MANNRRPRGLTNAAARRRYAANREYILAGRRKRYEQDEEVRRRANLTQTAYRNTIAPEQRMWTNAKNRAEASGISFNINISDIVIPTTCPYLGIPLVTLLGAGRSDGSASLDRIDNSLGYIKGNVEVISDLANRMKQNANPAQLVAFAREVLHRYRSLNDTRA